MKAFGDTGHLLYEQLGFESATYCDDWRGLLISFGSLIVVGGTLMNCHDGFVIRLGDIVNVPVPSGTARARVVMLGDTYEHLDIDPQFVAWVERDKVLEQSSVVVEWLAENPFSHNDPRYAPLGNYMFSPADEWFEREAEQAAAGDAKQRRA